MLGACSVQHGLIYIHKTHQRFLLKTSFQWDSEQGSSGSLCHQASFPPCTKTSWPQSVVCFLWCLHCVKTYRRQGCKCQSHVLLTHISTLMLCKLCHLTYTESASVMHASTRRTSFFMMCCSHYAFCVNMALLLCSMRHAMGINS